MDTLTPGHRAPKVTVAEKEKQASGRGALGPGASTYVSLVRTSHMTLPNYKEGGNCTLTRRSERRAHARGLDRKG